MLGREAVVKVAHRRTESASTTALLQQRLRKVEKERDVARKIEGRIRQEIRRRETQESVADDAGWKSGGEG